MKRSLIAVLACAVALAGAAAAQAPPDAPQGIYAASKKDAAQKVDKIVATAGVGSPALVASKMSDGPTMAFKSTASDQGAMHIVAGDIDVNVKKAIGDGSGDVRPTGLVGKEGSGVAAPEAKKMTVGGRAPPGSMTKTLFWLAPGADGNYIHQHGGVDTMPASANQTAPPLMVLRT